MVEYEYKMLLDYCEYMKIIQKINDRKEFIEMKENIQINYYYDFEDNKLLKKGVTCRARQIDNKLKLQLKVVKKRGCDYKVNKEFELPLEKLSKTIDLERIGWDKVVDIKGIVLLKGSLITHRKKWCFENNIEVFLDKNYYLGKIDYEIELEFLPGNEDDALKLVRVLTGKEIKKSCNGKKTRFFKKLKKFNGKEL